MGYLFLSVSLLSGAVKGFCGKKMGTLAENIQSAVLLNLFRMGLCVLFGIGLLLAADAAANLTPTPMLLGISALSGVSTAAFVVCWLLAVRKSAYMLMDVFLLLGTVIPMALGFALFSEPVSLRQGFGFLLLMAAAWIMCSYNNIVKSKLTVPAFLLLLSCGIANGAADFSQKLFVRMLPGLSVSVFNLYTYLFAGLTLAVCYFPLARKEKPRFENGRIKLSLLYLVIMAVALTANSYFKTLAAGYLDSARLYPLSQGASLGLATAMAAIFFKEKLTLRAFGGILLAFIALLLMNLS